MLRNVTLGSSLEGYSFQLLMVCSIGSAKMTALPRLVDAGSVSQNVICKEVIDHKKLVAQYIRREIQEADEANLLDEEDMHIFGLRPMTDPLDLVCCNSCKKPIKASHYAAHAEVCKSLSCREDISPDLDAPVNRKPPRKERKKSTQTKKARSARELKEFESLDSYDVAAPESHVAEKIQMNPSAEARRNTHLTSSPTMNGSTVGPYDMHCSEDATKGSSKPLKRTATENPSNPGAKNLCKTAAEVRPYVPAPLATKIYYSQRNHHLRRAISHMFFAKASKDVSNLELVQLNQAPRDDDFLHLAQTPDQIVAERSDCCVNKSGGLIPSMNTASQPPMNNALGSTHSFAGKSGNSLGIIQQGNGSVPVL